LDVAAAFPTFIEDRAEEDTWDISKERKKKEKEKERKGEPEERSKQERDAGRRCKKGTKIPWTGARSIGLRSGERW
jgi:hypothetical protein